MKEEEGRDVFQAEAALSVQKPRSIDLVTLTEMKVVQNSRCSGGSTIVARQIRVEESSFLICFCSCIYFLGLERTNCLKNLTFVCLFFLYVWDAYLPPLTSKNLTKIIELIVTFHKDLTISNSPTSQQFIT